ncbi:uncharacterized protein A4U43_C05F3430 [Asparagus officinalis]|uniref:HTH myb-type domain-containing protein n=1 Tax=Asparagus officinalis TaxID=4686 RepID=A0A5P1EPN4_ASPOF|nr:uncharacterized protein A4U43_C05F3430 [Asparagus officinalis]
MQRSRLGSAAGGPDSAAGGPEGIEDRMRFLNALQQLGVSHVGMPKQIRELMKVDGLTNDEVKSHLQSPNRRKKIASMAS